MSDANMPEPSSVSEKRRRWLGPAFLVSLIVNLFLAGLIVSAVVAHRSSTHRGGPFMFGGIRGNLSDVSKEDRAAMRKVMVGQFKNIRPQLVEMDKARKALAEVIGQTPYDPAKMAMAFDRVEQTQAAMAGITRDAMIKGFGQMSDAQRQRLSKVMAKDAERHWRHKRSGHDDGPPPPDGHGDNDGPDGPSVP